MTFVTLDDMATVAHTLPTMSEVTDRVGQRVAEPRGERNPTRADDADKANINRVSVDKIGCGLISLDVLARLACAVGVTFSNSNS
jgi:hypothetical protein